MSPAPGLAIVRINHLSDLVGTTVCQNARPCAASGSEFAS